MAIKTLDHGCFNLMCLIIPEAWHNSSCLPAGPAPMRQYWIGGLAETTQMGPSNSNDVT